MQELSAANSGFSIKLYKELAKHNAKKNLFYSPWSISVALGMVYQGARGNTATQMGEVLLFNTVGKSLSAAGHAPQPASCGMEQQVQACIPPGKIPHHDVDTRSILPAYQALSGEINKPNSNYTLESASNMYVEKTYHVKKEYVNDIKKYFTVEPENVNFAGEAEKAREKINSWVDKKTKSKIRNILPQGSLDASTIMVLVNAIYFKGNWDKQFSKDQTQKKDFRMTKTSKKPVQMMFKKAKFNIAHALIPGCSFKVLELPYVKGDLSMLILLPDDIEDNSTGLEKLEHSMTNETLSEWTRSDKMRSAEVEVSLPTFKLEESYDMKEVLIVLGMSDAFSGKADFVGMSDKKDLYLSKVFHKAFVEVNEEGTEAAAATAAVISLTAMPMPSRVESFNANHPFLFFIRHNKTNTILFQGRFCSP